MSGRMVAFSVHQLLDQIETIFCIGGAVAIVVSCGIVFTKLYIRGE